MCQEFGSFRVMKATLMLNSKEEKKETSFSYMLGILIDIIGCLILQEKLL